MREKKRRVPGARGFTAIEVVVTVVVLAILAAYATPKLFGLKDQAKEAEETLKIQDIASRHAKEMLEQGKRSGSLPIPCPRTDPATASPLVASFRPTETELAHRRRLHPTLLRSWPLTPSTMRRTARADILRSLVAIRKSQWQ